MRKTGVESLPLLQFTPEHFLDLGGIVTEDVRVVSLPEVDVLVAVQVPDPAAPAFDVVERVRLEQPEVVTPSSDLIPGRLVKMSS
jgi:hypothetical protein